MYIITLFQHTPGFCSFLAIIGDVFLVENFWDNLSLKELFLVAGESWDTTISIFGTFFTSPTSARRENMDYKTVVSYNSFACEK